MLQPGSYPEMLGKALVFEAEPFITMTDDDNPWAEGLFMVVLMGVLVGLAKIAGALLTTASMPSAASLQAAILPVLRQYAALAGPAGGEEWLRQWLPAGAGIFGFGWSWMQFGWILLAPFVLVIQWLIYGLVAYGVARMLGGQGRLTQTLGAVALMVAPQMFVLLEVVPFAAVSNLLLAVWAVLIVYRAVEVSHELPWRKAAMAAIATPALLILLVLTGLTAFAVAAAIAGGIP